ncbi:mitochondrial ubiquitin ligase activator of nfkb 1-A [Brienomyrus brachyistius]|uniref:mitochondrial ubiquitin ligase activator of nfkb 1-A n=1 Tax=Brienomyrus brachyistius TaxID=42636 RepID=UPI0020B34649|nr:mitochondrial ubiquitin ligase activator of nfkb 1-A [Brienomyrus brachyistius]XP_048845396.1 mitochondrial ubiquitin ligase activator of nfkb 1-A [Brienomyrus brachyistius]
MSDVPVSPLTAICVGSAFAFSGLFYHLHRQKKQEIKKLYEIPKFQPNEELVKIVKATPNKNLRYVAIEGVVEPEGNPLASHYVPRCFGVIQKIVVSEHWKVWNPLTRVWNVRNMNKKETNTAVPFSLVAPGAFINAVSVKVQSPMEAGGSYLEQVYQRVQHAKKELVDFVVQELSGEKPMVLEEREELLRVGTVLTGFGQVVLEHDHVLILQPPHDGRPYLLFPGDHYSFMQMHHNSANMWKLLSAAFGITGAALLAWAMYRRYNTKEETRNTD